MNWIRHPLREDVSRNGTNTNDTWQICPSSSARGCESKLLALIVDALLSICHPLREDVSRNDRLDYIRL